MATVALQGQTVHTIGELPEVGSAAPDFKLVNSKLQDKTLADYAGKKVLLNIVPSLDTPVCALSTKRFNQLAEGRGDAVMLMISSDLPFAQSRFCGVEKLKNVQPLSLMRSRKFAKDYGVLLIDGPLAGITARAVVVIDAQGKVVHAELVDDIANEPDYDAAMKCL
ncbi:thiol peroxidase [Candidatus Tenderia electrophaga]|jgi:thiol peroxidase|uniref:Thiol peroxidase n=1 Tax=Candidatus Tenderia electrophaga TaxID=1748243 RepID=A0A0S2TA22_9GAMM|nr:thiol peroxidase [Candidatus Tenderia electrophaga]